MLSATRFTRNAAAVAEEAESLSVRERLIFAQAVFEFGAKEWSQVVDILASHPMISRPKNFFNAQSCPVIYAFLMNEAELERSDAAEGKKATINRKLAERYYRVHMQNLRDGITAEETRFRLLVKEIDEIRSGQWDDRIREQLNISRAPVDNSATTVNTKAEAKHKVIVEQTETTPVRSAITSPTPATTSPLEVAESLEEPVSTPLEHATPMDISSPIHSPPLIDSTTDAVEEAAEEEVVDVEVQNGEEDEEDVNAETKSETMEEESREEESREEEHPPVATRSSGRRRRSTVERVPQLVADVVSTSKASHREKPSSRSSRKSSARSDRSEKGLEDAAEEAQETEQVEDVVMEDGPEQSPEDVDEGSDPEEEASPELENEQDEVDVLEDENDIARSVSRTTSPEPRSKRESKRRAQDTEDITIDSARDRKRARDDSEPADEEESPATPSAGPGRRIQKMSATERRRFQNVIYMLHAQISQHRSGTIFHNPIKHSDAPDYHDIIKRPMDLKTIKARVRDGLIGSSVEYQRDIYLMFANSLMYNRPNSDIYAMAEEMMLESEEHINNFRQTEGFTRTRT